MTTIVERLNEALQGMERNLDGLLPETFDYYHSVVKTELRRLEGTDEYAPNKVLYDAIIKVAKDRGLKC